MWGCIVRTAYGTHLCGGTIPECSRQHGSLLGSKTNNLSLIVGTVRKHPLQLGGNGQSSSATAQTSLNSRGNQRARPRALVQKCSGGRRNESYAVVAQPGVSSADREESPGSGTQAIAQESSPISNSITGSCRVCVANSETMDWCTFAVKRTS